MSVSKKKANELVAWYLQETAKKKKKPGLSAVVAKMRALQLVSSTKPGKRRVIEEGLAWELRRVFACPLAPVDLLKMVIQTTFGGTRKPNMRNMNGDYPLAQAMLCGVISHFDIPLATVRMVVTRLLPAVVDRIEFWNFRVDIDDTPNWVSEHTHPTVLKWLVSSEGGANPLLTFWRTQCTPVMFFVRYHEHRATHHMQIVEALLTTRCVPAQCRETVLLGAVDALGNGVAYYARECPELFRKYAILRQQGVAQMVVETRHGFAPKTHASLRAFLQTKLPRTSSSSMQKKTQNMCAVHKLLLPAKKKK